MLAHKLTRKDHKRLVVEKLYMARGILSKLRRHVPQSVLKCVIIVDLVYPYLYYSVTVAPSLLISSGHNVRLGGTILVWGNKQ